MRGLAVVIMIQCHTFNSLARLDLREGGPYVLSQFVGGMAAPLFLFMAGMTSAFLMETLERRGVAPWQRYLAALGRAGYIFSIACLFRLTNWAATVPRGSSQELLRVDILNCMGLAMAVVAVVAVLDGGARARVAAAMALLIAAAAPVMAGLAWDRVPRVVQEYLVPAGGRGQFPLFPCAAYLGFGLAAGTIVKRSAAERFERLMQWSVVIGFGLIFTAQYFANVPYSIYSRSNFWLDSPALVIIRTGIALLMLAGSYLWTEYCRGAGWSWIECIGKNSLMVYWVHVILVYGTLVQPLKRSLSIPLTALAVVLVTGLMVALSALWLWWKCRRAARWRARTTVAGGLMAPAGVSGRS